MADKGLKVNFAFQDEHFVMSADKVRETMDLLASHRTRNVFAQHQHGIDYASIYQKPGHFEDFDIDYNKVVYGIDPAMIPPHQHTFVSGANPWVQKTIKEIKMKNRKMLKPAKQIARRDLITAAEVLNLGYLDGLLDAVAIVQGLAEGEVLTTAGDLKQQHNDTRVRVIGGPRGVLSDVKPYDRDRNYQIQAVIDGKLYELERDDYVVLNVPAPRGGYISRPNASDS